MTSRSMELAPVDLRITTPYCKPVRDLVEFALVSPDANVRSRLGSARPMVGPGLLYSLFWEEVRWVA
jgi:hypothetical protein